MTELQVSHIYSSSELNGLGYSSNALTNLIRSNQLTRVQRGFYALRDNSDDLYTIVQLFPEGILCLESAMYFYGYLDKEPKVHQIAVHKCHNRNKYSHCNLPLKAYFRDDKYIDLGVKKTSYKGLNCLIYDKERCLCDCIRRKELLNENMYRIYIQKYKNDSEKNIERLRKYAKELRIVDKVEFLIESVL